jgi:predicted metal-dependent phosphoesterase TrpH
MLNSFLPSVMPAIDLHSHSLYSDGSLAPGDLCRLAADRGVEILALTDHDSIRGLPEAAEAAAACGLRLINGVEISALWGNTLVHVLGLNVDIRNIALQENLNTQAGARGKRARLIADRLAALGKGESWEFVLAAAEGDADRVGRTHFARYLMDSGHVRNLQQAFTRFLGDGKPARRSHSLGAPANRDRVDSGVGRGAGAGASFALRDIANQAACVIAGLSGCRWCRHGSQQRRGKAQCGAATGGVGGPL